jgi:hypothetical protein
MQRLNRLFTFLAAIVCLASACVAQADKIYLKDGRVFEGTVEREEADFVFFIIEVGGIRNTQLFTRDEVDRIERDGDGGADADETPDAPAGVIDAAESDEDAAREQAIAAGATKIAFITLGEPPADMVGPYMNADALRRSIDMLEDDEPDIVVLWINSGGGFVVEVEPLSSLIENYIKPRYRVVAWLESSISAAAMTANTCEEIYFMSRGHYGAVVAFSQNEDGKLVAAKADDLEGLLRYGQMVSERGNRDPLIMKAMQTRIALSCDIDENGVVHWREDESGEHIVSQKDEILTLNSVDARRFRVSDGTADSKDELAALLGATEWVEVGLDAERYQQEFRDNVFRAESEIAELLAKLNLAMSSGQVGRARRFLGELRSWARRAPSWTVYPSELSPPLSPFFFTEMERQIEQMRRNSR